MVVWGMDWPTRKELPHEVPPWVESGSPFFLTVCCAERGPNQLCNSTVACRILEAVRHYQSANEWYCQLLLLMPDHLHAIAAFPPEVAMERFVRKFKIFTSRCAQVRWQRGFFDHRLRNQKERAFKEDYIRRNPVRAGLIEDAMDWPFVWDVFRDRGG